MDGSSQGSIEPVRIGADQLLQTFLAPTPDGARAMVVAVDGDPKLADDRDWAGAVYNGRSLGRQDRNLYACAARIRPDANGRFRRRQEQAVPAVLVIDDVGHGAGSKVDPERLANLTPSAVIATSPGNTQWLLRLSFDCTLEGVQALYRALKRAGLTDPGAADAVRLFRLPGGLNLKPSACSPNGGPWRVRCTAWNPDWDYHTSEIADLLGLDLTEPPVSGPTASPDFDHEREAEALCCIPPSVGRDEWFRIGCGLHHATGGGLEGLALWESWSSGELAGVDPPDNYVEGHCERTWRSLGRPRSVITTLATVHQIAQRHGWTGLAVQAFADVDADETGSCDEENAPVQLVAAMLRDAWRHEMRHSVSRRNRALREGMAEFPTVSAALEDPDCKLIAAETGGAKTYTLMRLAIQRLQNSDRSVPPIVIAVATRRDLHDGARMIQAEVGAEIMPRCAVIEHAAKTQPLRQVDGTWTYQVILCTHGAIHRQGDNTEARGRLLRLLSGARELEIKHGWSHPPVEVFVDEGDAFCGRAESVIPLGYRTMPAVSRTLTKAHDRILKLCPQGPCVNCRLHIEAVAVDTVRSDIEQMLFLPAMREAPTAIPIPLPWLVDALDEPIVRGGYRFHRIRVESLPDVPALYPDLDETGKTVWKTSPEGIIVQMMRAPGATVRYAHPIDRRTQQPLDPGGIEDGQPDVLWPKYPCQVPHLVTWDVSVFQDLTDLAGCAPTFLTASYTPASLGMLQHVYGELPMARVLPDDRRKIEKILFAVVADTRLDEELAEALQQVGKTLHICRSKKDALQAYEGTRQWVKGGLRTGLYSDGHMRTDEENKATWAITYSRSALARGANLGGYFINIVDADPHDSMLTVPVIGADDIFEAVLAESQARMIQSFGRTLRPDKDNPEDRLWRVLILRTKTDPVTGALVNDGSFYHTTLQLVAKDVVYLTLALFGRKVAIAVQEFAETGTTLVDDSPPPGLTVGNMNRKQRQATKEDRVAEKARKRLERTEAQLDEMARNGDSWAQARRRANLNRKHSPEEIQALKRRFQNRP